MFSFSKLDSKKYSDTAHSKSPLRLNDSSLMVRALYSNPVYQAKKDKQSSRRLDLTQALEMDNGIPISGEHTFRERKGLNQKVKAKQIDNIESHKLSRSKSAKTRSRCRPKRAAYYQMDRSYSKYFSYTPNVVEAQRTNPLTNERCRSAIPGQREMSAQVGIFSPIL